MLYECPYCNAIFKTSTWFLKHNCKQKQRLDEFKTPIGQIAFIYYEKWLKKQFGKCCDAESFLSSKYYNAFIKFAQFVKKIKGFVNADEFVQLMIDNKFPPFMWINPTVYIKYIKHIENTTTANEKISISLNTLYAIADVNDCDISKVFKYMDVQRVMQLIYEQKLSPWVLLHSGKFMTYVMNLNEEQQKILDDFINPSVWKQTFETHPKTVAVIKKCIKQLKL